MALFDICSRARDLAPDQRKHVAAPDNVGGAAPEGVIHRRALVKMRRGALRRSLATAPSGSAPHDCDPVVPLRRLGRKVSAPPDCAVMQTASYSPTMIITNGNKWPLAQPRKTFKSSNTIITYHRWVLFDRHSPVMMQEAVGTSRQGGMALRRMSVHTTQH